jgi:hypothetical protein
VIGSLVLVWSLWWGQGEEVVNVPYPLSPQKAASAFLRVLEDCQPKAWTAAGPGATGPFLLAGTLQAKINSRDGAVILMIRPASGACVLVKSPEALPELAVDQRLYAVVDFQPGDEPGTVRLRAIALAADLGEKSGVLEALVGLGAGASGGGGGAAAASVGGGQGGAGGAQQPAAAAIPALGQALSPPGSPPPPPRPQPRWSSVDQPPGEDPQERARVEFWKDYVHSHNRRLTEKECEAIVRWVLYYSAYFGVDHRLVFAVMKCESNFDPGCLSHAGAIGLMQLMPETARELGVDPWVVEENIKGGVQELAGYLDKYAGRPNFEQCALALACYNAGPNAVKRAGGIPQIPETVAYVSRVTKLFAELVEAGAP